MSASGTACQARPAHRQYGSIPRAGLLRQICRHTLNTCNRGLLRGSQMHSRKYHTETCIGYSLFLFWCSNPQLPVCTPSDASAFITSDISTHCRPPAVAISRPLTLDISRSTHLCDRHYFRLHILGPDKHRHPLYSLVQIDYRKRTY